MRRIRHKWLCAAARYRRELEHAVTGISPDAAVQTELRRRLDVVLAEQSEPPPEHSAAKLTGVEVKLAWFAPLAFFTSAV